jgi:hypothetical protein
MKDLTQITIWDWTELLFKASIGYALVVAAWGLTALMLMMMFGLASMLLTG